ncbi:MAG: hypothetical protein LBT30_04155 [Clostridiales bacterium]|jgi:hypothetical protein|nr:hypothetical protein [Clostridiales bacterium]
MIWDEVISMAVANGLFAVLFVALLLYILKDGRAREAKYQSTIKQLSSALLAVNDIKIDIETIKKRLFRTAAEPAK